MRWIILAFVLAAAAFLFFFRIGVKIERGPKPYRMRWMRVVYGQPSDASIQAEKAGNLYLAGCFRPNQPFRQMLVINVGPKEVEPVRFVSGILPLKMTIAVSHPEPKQLVVTVGYSNVSDSDIFVLKDDPSLFVEADGKEIDDIGPSDKRTAYTFADYERVAPRRTIERRRDIASTFAWKPGSAPRELGTSKQGESPCRVRSSQPPVPSVALVKERP